MTRRHVVTMVTSMQPETHYSRYLCGELDQRLQLRVLAERDERNSALPLRSVHPAWSPGSHLVTDILRAIGTARNQVVHIQYEFNMYGGARGALQTISMLRTLRRRGIATVVTMHAVVLPSQVDRNFLSTFSLPQFPYSELVVREGFRLFYHLVGRSADRVIVHTEVMRDQLAKFYGVPHYKTVAIPIGIPEKPARIVRPRANWLERLDGRPYALFFGYLLRRKGLETLIDAFAAVKQDVPEALLVLAGGELEAHREYAEGLKQRAASSPCGRDIIFTSFVGEEDIAWLFHHARMAVLPYTTTVASGSLPLSFAVQFRCPVVASDTPPFRELNEQHAVALLSLPGDSTDLARAMKRLFTDDQVAHSLRRAEEDAAVELSWARHAGRTEAVYAELAT